MTKLNLVIVLSISLIAPSLNAQVLSSFPSCENFDGWLPCGNNEFTCIPDQSCVFSVLSPGWVNAAGDSIDWSIDSSRTPSAPETGPNGDHTGGTGGSGYFIYTEASGGIACNDQVAIMESPAYDLSVLAEPELEFWYNMNGADMGILQVDVEDPANSGNWVNLITITGEQGPNWYRSRNDLAAHGSDTVRFRFVGITGNGFESDLAIDDVCVKEAPTCPDPTNLSAIDITENDATIIWQSPNDGAQFLLEGGPAGFLPGAGRLFLGIADSGLNTFTITDSLPSNTSMDFYLWEVCTPADTSALIGPFTFTTLAGPPPANDSCIHAVEVTCGDIIVDSTTNAHNFDAPAFCGTDLNAGPGMWYIFQGNGLDITVSTCSAGTKYDTKLGVFEGPCNSLSCVNGDDDDVLCSIDDFYTTVTFTSAPGIDYYIYVTGYESDSGIFELSVQCAADLVINEVDYDQPGIDHSEFIELKNTGLIPIDLGLFDLFFINGSSGTIIYDSISLPNVMLAAGDYFVICSNPANVSNCDLDVTPDMDLIQNGAPDALALVAERSVIDAVSYEGDVDFPFTETSGILSADDNTTPNIGISRFPDGTDSDQNDMDFSVQCITPGLANSPDDADCAPSVCNDPDSLRANNITHNSADLVWRTGSINAEFYIEYGPAGFAFGNGIEDNGTVGMDGPPFTITGLTPSTAYEFYVWEECFMLDSSNIIGPGKFSTASLHDSCINARPVGCGMTIIDSTVMAGADTALGSCGVDLTTAPGVWFSIAGTGDTVIVSTCNSGTNFNTRIGIFTGTCDSLICVRGNNNTMQCLTDTTFSTVKFVSMPGSNYYIYVTGEDTSGIFELSVNCIPPSLCVDPMGLTAIALSTTTADISWNSSNPGADYFLEIGTMGFTPGGAGSLVTTTGVTVNGLNNYNAAGLSPSTYYDFYVLEDCGVDSSANVGPITFVTLGNPTACGLNVPVPDNSCGGGGLAYPIVVTNAGGTQLGNDVALLTVDIIIAHSWVSDLDIRLTSPNGVTIDLSTDNGGANMNYGNPADTSCNLTTTFSMTGVDGPVTGGTAPFLGSFVPEGDFSDFNDGSDPNGTWELLICDDVAGQTGALQYAALMFSQPCEEPTALNVSNVSSTGVDVNWTSQNPGAGYTVEWGAAGFVTGGGAGSLGTVTGTSLAGGNTTNITGLSASIGYEFYVYENCGSLQSDTAGPQVFVTLRDNNVCSGAVTIGCGDVILDSTTAGVTNIDGPSTCGAPPVVLNTAPGLWYKFPGNGLNVTISTCGAGTNFDTKLGVFEGPCLALSCITAGDDDCGLQSAVSFSSEIGTDYYIYVTAFGANTGVFELSVECSADLVINEIDYGQPGADDAEFIELKNIGSADVNLDFVQVVLVNGTGGGAVEYDTIDLPNTVLPVGDYYVLCGNAANVFNCDLDISQTGWLRDGSPDAIALVINGVIIDVVSYNGDAGIPYVEGSGAGLSEDTGMINIGISRLPDGVDTDQNNADFSQRCISPGVSNISQSTSCSVPNDSCINATVVVPGIGVSWDNRGATTDGPDAAGTPCDVNGQTNIHQDIWYQFTAVCNGVATWSTCGLTTVDTRLAVYSGGCPSDNTNFIDCSDDALGCADFTSEVTWNITSGMTYYLRLGTYSAGIVPGTGTFNLIVTDAVPPTILCSPDQFKSNDPGTCSATIAVNDPIAADNCGAVTVLNNFNGTTSATDIYPLGTTTVTWTATDASGLTANCTQDITVTDDEDPVITCAPNQTQTADVNDCNAAVTVTAPSAFDNCSAISLTNDFNGTADASDTFSVGITVVIWTATDTNSNTSTCAQTITVTDDESPNIICPADIIIALCDSNAVVPSPVTSDNCAVATVINDFTGTNDASGIYPMGTTTITWTVTDIHGNSSDCKMDITRNTPPQVGITPDPAEACASADYVLDGNVVPGSGSLVNQIWTGTGVVMPYTQSTATFNAGVPGVYGPVTYTVTDVNGCTATDDIQVTVLPNPAPNIIPDVVEICAGDSVQLQGNPTGGNGAYTDHAWTGDTAVLFNVNISNPVASTSVAGNYNLTYTVTDSKACKGSDDVTLVVNANPSVNITPDPARVCQNKPLIMRGNPLIGSGSITSRLWSGDTGPLSTLSGAITNFNTAISGNYKLTFTVTDDNTCMASDSTTVIVDSIPVVSFSGLAAEYCSEDDVDTLSGTPAGGTFSGVGISGNIFDPLAAGPGTHTIVYSFSDGNGCSNSSSQNVMVHTNPVADAGAGQTICVGDNATLTATGGGTYLWNTGDNTASIIVNPTATTTYRITVTSTSGCEDMDSVEVVVDTLPVVSFTGLETDYCINSGKDTLTGIPASGSFSGPGISVTGTGPSSNTYTGAPEFILSSTTTIIADTITGVTGNVLGTDVILKSVCLRIDHGWIEDLDITLESPNGNTVVLFDRECGSSNNMDACFVTGPGANVNCGLTPPAVTGNITAAPGNDLDDLNDGSANPNGVWQLHITDNVGGDDGNLVEWSMNFNSTGIVTFDPSDAGSGTHTVSFTFTDENGCSNSVSQQTTIFPAPTVVAGPDTSVCGGASVTLTASGGANYLWSNGDTTANINVNPTVTTVYTVTVTDANGCEATDDVTVNVYPAPVASAGADKTICEGESIILTATGGVAYQWNTGASTKNITVSPIDTSEYIVNVTNANGCTASDTVVVNVNPVPTADAGSSVSICEGESTTLTASGGNTYLWITNENTATIVVSPIVNTIYSVTVADNNGCAATATVTVTVNSFLTIGLTGLNSQYCINSGAAVLTGIPTGGIFSGPGVSGNTFDPAAAGVGGPYAVKYVYSGGQGCSDSISKQVRVVDTPVATLSGLDAEYCLDTAAVSLVGTPPGGVFSGPGISGSSFVSFFAGAGTHQISYTFTDPSSGCSNTAKQTILVHSNPVVNIQNLNAIYCANDSPVIMKGIPAGGIFNGPGVVDSLFDPASVMTGVNHLITYTYTDANGCQNIKQKTVKVNPVPVPIILNMPGSFCINRNPLTLMATPAGGTFSGPGVNNNIFDPAAAGVGNHDLIYTLNNSNGCTGTATKKAIVIPAPTVSLTGLSQKYCVNDDIDILTGIPSGGTFSGPGIIGNSFDPSLPGTGGPYNVIYKYTDSLGCGGVDTQEVTILNAPFLFITGLNAAYCVQDDPVIITGTPAGGTFSGAGITDSTFNPSAAGTGIHTIRYRYTNINNCTEIAEVKVRVDPCPGIDDIQSIKNVRIYPNPTTGVFNVELEGKLESMTTIRIYNLEGKVIEEKLLNNGEVNYKGQFDLSSFARGMYYVKIFSESDFIIRKVVAQ